MTKYTIDWDGFEELEVTVGIKEFYCDLKTKALYYTDLSNFLVQGNPQFGCLSCGLYRAWSNRLQMHSTTVSGYFTSNILRDRVDTPTGYNQNMQQHVLSSSKETLPIFGYIAKVLNKPYCTYKFKFDNEPKAGYYIESFKLKDLVVMSCCSYGYVTVTTNRIR